MVQRKKRYILSSPFQFQHTMSDSVVTQDILGNESEKPVWTTSEDIKSDMADHYRTGTTSHGRIRYPPTWQTEYYSPSTVTSK